MLVGSGPGVDVWESSDVDVLGNTVGYEAGGAPVAGQFGAAISVQYSTNVHIGDATRAGAANQVGPRTGAAVQVIGDSLIARYSTGVAIRRNRFTGATLGIDLMRTGATPNDPGDADERDNRTINTPVLLGALLDATTGTLDVTLRLETPPAAARFPLDVDVYAADASGLNGETWIGAATVTEAEWPAGAAMYTRIARFTGIAPELFGGGQLIATTTDADGNTSEFSNVQTSLLPVELAALTAVADGGAVWLRWTTASETNSAGFGVEVRPEGGVWTERAFVAGQGTTAEAHAYGTRIAPLAPGRYALRLHQVDLDGTVRYAGQVEAEVGATAPLALTVAPNPARAGRVMVRVEAAQHLRVAVYDALGREVMRLQDGRVEAGAALGWPVAGLAPGRSVVQAWGSASGRASAALTVVR